MAMDGLPEGVPPSGGVPEQLLQAAPILKRRRRRYRGEFANMRSIFRVSSSGVKIGAKGSTERVHREARRPPGESQGGAAPGTLLESLWWPPLSFLGDFEGFRDADFLYNFSGIFGALLIVGNPEYKNNRKKELTLRCTHLIG